MASAGRHDSVTVPGGVFRRASTVNPQFEELTAVSQNATDFESRMGIREAAGLYRPAIFWSLLLSMGVIMEGYDIVLISSFFALDSFNQKYYNQLTPSGEAVISAPWKSALSNGAIVGEIIGLLLTGYIQEKIGYKKTIAGAITMLAAFVFIQFFAQNLATLFIGDILCGLPWGAFQTVTTAYASEVAPVALRAYLTTYVNLCWVFGQLVVTGVLRALADREDQWAYRIPFAVQWVWVLPIFVGALLAPESPWWLVRQRRTDDARAALRRLTCQEPSDDFIDKTVAMMEHTTLLEEQMVHGTSYFHLFRGVDRRRTEIVCMTWLTQATCGTCFMGYLALILTNATVSSKDAFDFQLGLFGFGAIGVFLSWFFMAKFGRRTLYVTGTGLLSIMLLIIGSLGAIRDIETGRWALGAMILLYAFIYDSTIGPVCYSLVAELPSTKLKAKTIVLARSTFNVGSIIVNILASYQFTSTAWNWGAYAGFFWFGTNTLCFIWMYFRLPEPKNRSYGELDILFENRVPARRFSKTQVDIYRGMAFDSYRAQSEEEARSSGDSPVFQTVHYEKKE